jgi:pentatricopeptide repeat domain-containing protein 1
MGVLFEALQDKGYSYDYSEWVKRIERIPRIKWQKAEYLLERMRLEGVPPSSLTHEAMLGTYKRNQWPRAIWLLEEVDTLRLETDSSRHVNMYQETIEHCSQRSWVHALRLFEEMQGRELEPDVKGYNWVMVTYTQAGQFHRALATMEEMLYRAVELDTQTYNEAILSCRKQADTQRALAFFARMRQESLQPNRFSYNLILATHSQLAEWETALALFEEMQVERQEGRLDYDPDSNSYNCVISACSRAGEWTLALQLLRDMQAADLVASDLEYSSVIASTPAKEALSLFAEIKNSKVALGSGVYMSMLLTCAYDGKLKWMDGLFAEMRYFQVRMQECHYRVIMHAKGCKLPRTGSWKSVLDHFSEMKNDAIRPGSASYHIATVACAISKKWQEALHLLREVTEDGRQPRAESYNMVVRMCETLEKWQLVFVLAAEMQQRSVASDRLAWDRTIAASEQGKRWDVAVDMEANLLEQDMKWETAQEEEASLRELEEALNLFAEAELPADDESLGRGLTSPKSQQDEDELMWDALINDNL